MSRGVLFGVHNIREIPPLLSLGAQALGISAAFPLSPLPAKLPMSRVAGPGETQGHPSQQGIRLVRSSDAGDLCLPVAEQRSMKLGDSEQVRWAGKAS